MAWTTPITWANGDVITEGQLNQQVRDNLSYLYIGHYSIAVACRAAVQSLSNETYTAISLDTEDTDTEGYITIASTPTRIVMPRKGHYLFDVHIAYAANATGLRLLELRRDGGAADIQIVVPPFATFDTTVHLPFITAERNAGSYYEIYGWQNSTGALNVTARVAVTLLRDST